MSTLQDDLAPKMGIHLPTCVQIKQGQIHASRKAVAAEARPVHIGARRVLQQININKMTCL